MKNNSFQEFIWERDGNGDYLVTDKKTARFGPYGLQRGFTVKNI